MEQAQLETTKFRDFALGFFGWFVYANFLFGVMMYEVSELPDTYGNPLSYLIIAAIWLPVLILPPMLFSQKRDWLGMGIVGAVLVNIGVYLIVMISAGIPVAWSGFLLPMPSGLPLFFGD